MSKEAILQIRRTEEQAEKIREDAALRAKTMVADSEKSASALKDQIEQKTSEELRETLTSMRSKADALIEKISSEAYSEANEITKTADAHMREAVKKIVWEIVENVSK